MAHFVRHAPCPACGSRDNLGIYSDGSKWCFGCKYRERGDLSGIHLHDKRADDGNDASATGAVERAVAYHGSPEIAEPGLQWLGRFGITVQECLLWGIRWDPKYEQLVFHFHDEAGKLRCTQARNFNRDRAAKAKYYNVGNKEDSFQVYQSQSTEVSRRLGSLCITEDALSAIKVGRQVPAMPALGTSVSKARLIKIQRQGYQKVLVWLDRDKFKEAMEIADMCKWLGMSAKAIYSEKDPKEYDDEEIKSFLS